MENTTYHEIDFLLPAQRFNINFSYITEKGLPFVREFVLRLVHLAPLTKSQVVAFFGFSKKEADEVISDLVERDELTLSEEGRLALTEKSSGYFTEIGEVPRLSQLKDSGVCLSFDLATFTCLGRDIATDKWRAGVQLKIDPENFSKSEELVGRQFQRQFNEFLRKGLLSKSIVQDEKEAPNIYTVNSVSKIKQLPFRIPVQFQMDEEGASVERDDFDMLSSSDYVHECVAVELNRFSRSANFIDIAKSMMDIGDSDTLRLFDVKRNSINLKFLEELNQIEENNQDIRTTFLGPIYSQKNWELLQRYLAPVLAARIESKSDVGKEQFVWIAPGDQYWSKSNRLLDSLSDFFNKSSTKEKKLYSPMVYLPVAKSDDDRSVRQWRQEFESYVGNANGLLEGFLNGNVEVLHFVGELAVIVYHMSLPDTYPVTLPVGFVTKDKEVVSRVGKLVRTYIDGSAGFDRPNDCGAIIEMQRSK
ncbi:hypothetical protein SBO82_00595 [Alcaligenes nematophilus]|uniref:hypothetical protein n=1 Tax=Alcaligenes nematophilus TaxID=2994643 RepID=UPI002463CB5E|nr:hypothetical protein [Alcaligenes nematophilus]MDH4865458.1 hypothetical protein [Bacillus cereus]MDY7126755.1 hypothetical protein [Alcaligenes nematophilus]